MFKVLHMFLGNTKGGRTQYMLNTWKYIDHDMFHFDFLTLCDHLDYEDDLKKTGSDVIHISCYAEDNPQLFTKEILSIFEKGYDAIHVHFSFWRGFLIEECAKRSGIRKVILHSHNNGISMVGSENEAAELKKEHLRLRELITPTMATDFLACSKVAADWMYSDKIPSNKITIVRNGIALDKYVFNENIRILKRHELQLGEMYVIGCVAKFNYQKNHAFLIEVFSELVKHRNNIVLLLIGTGELQNEIKDLVLEKQIDDKVIFLGKRNDVSELMQAMDLFVLPSRFDGSPLSFIEAQAAGLPCVVGNVPNEDCLTDRSYRLPFDVKKWVEVIVGEIDNKQRNTVPDERMRLYDIHNQVNALTRIYTSFEGD